YLTALPNITGLLAITALSEKLTEPPAGIVIGAVKVNVVVEAGGVTVTDCPPPLRVMELNKPGGLTLIVADRTASGIVRLLATVKVPAATVPPGGATLVTDVLVTMTPGLGVGVGPVPPKLVAVGVGVAFSEAFAVGLGVPVAVGLEVV